QIAMKDSPVASGGQPGAQLACDFHNFLDWESPDPLQQRGEVLTVDVLHREEMSATVFADVVHPADVRMRNLPGEAYFVDETLHTPYDVGELRRKELQSNPLSHLEVVGSIHVAHSAASEQAHDPVSPSNDGAWLKSRWIG